MVSLVLCLFWLHPSCLTNPHFLHGARQLLHHILGVPTHRNKFLTKNHEDFYRGYAISDWLLFKIASQLLCAKKPLANITVYMYMADCVLLGNGEGVFTIQIKHSQSPSVCYPEI